MTDLHDPPAAVEIKLSPSRLNDFLACEHRTYLDIRARRGELAGEQHPPDLTLMFERGEAFEATVLARMRVDHARVRSLDATARGPARAAATIKAMHAGFDVIHQGCFTDGTTVGYPDFLVRVDGASDLGDYSYEVHDAKLGSTPKPSHIFQLLFYTEALTRAQGRPPARMHLILGSDERPGFTPDEFAAYAARIESVYAARHAELVAGDEPAYPYPVAACDYCPWWKHCDTRRRTDDHISLVAGLHRHQGLLIEQQGVHDVASLAGMDASATAPGLAAATLTRLRGQADLQWRSRGRPTPLYELLEPAAGCGLARLPARSPGDVFFDFEGDPNWGEEGLEYLFGTAYEDDDGTLCHRQLWSQTRAEEKLALEQWMDWIRARLIDHPDLHIYHYGAYEQTALKQLVARHATREVALDDLLRAKAFVELHGVTRQAARIGVESYGLKSVEAVYGFARNPALRGAIGSLRRWQDFLDTGDRAPLEQIGLYNRDDCLSTRALTEWLRDRRGEAETQFDMVIDALASEPPPEPTDAQLARQQRTEALRGELLVGLPDDETDDSSEQRARRQMFSLTGYHEREAKPGWWAWYDRRTMSVDELRDDDGEAIGDLELCAVEETDTAWEWTLTYPPQDHKLAVGSADDPVAQTPVTVLALDDAERRVVVRRAKTHGATPPRALAPHGPLRTDAQIDAVFELAEDVAQHGLKRPGIGRDLLLARAPRLRPGTPPLSDAPPDIPRLTAQIAGLDHSVIVVQGPPGTGKTWTGARVALGLIAAGRRVGVMSTAHKAVDNFLAAIDQAADETGMSFRGWRKKHTGGGYCSDRVHCSTKPREKDGPVMLHAGVAWHWASSGAADSVDVLLVDEAGQVSFADAVAVGRGAKSMVLLGDPQQLPHVSQGTHPLGVGVSVLEHLIGDADTVAADRGVLLEQSWRMAPDLCGFVSHTMYDSRLRAEPGCARQRVDSPGLAGTGLRMRAVPHTGNTGRSRQEAEVIAQEIDALLAGGSYTDRDGRTRPLQLADILVVTPYNAQVRCLTAALPSGARIGTVDKFQGQEAPIVFFSMATSSGEDVSRGMGFLFSRNRLNVAISRAQALAVVVCSPALLQARCSTVEDMRLVNMLCLAADAAGAM